MFKAEQLTDFIRAVVIFRESKTGRQRGSGRGKLTEREVKRRDEERAGVS
jgi:hypothetical protein